LTWGILPIKYKHRHHNTQNRKGVHRRIQSQMYTLQREEQRKTPATGSNVKNTSDSASTHLDREKGKRLNYEIQRDNKNASTEISRVWH